MTSLTTTTRCRFCNTKLPQPSAYSDIPFLSPHCPLDGSGQPSKCTICHAPSFLTLYNINLYSYLQAQNRLINSGLPNCNPMLTELLFEYVPIDTLWTCRAVCRAWCAISPASRHPHNQNTRIFLWGERISPVSQNQIFDARLRKGDITRFSRQRIFFARFWMSGYCVSIGDVVQIKSSGNQNDKPFVAIVQALFTSGLEVMRKMQNNIRQSVSMLATDSISSWGLSSATRSSKFRNSAVATNRHLSETFNTVSTNSTSNKQMHPSVCQVPWISKRASMYNRWCFRRSDLNPKHVRLTVVALVKTV